MTVESGLQATEPPREFFLSLVMRHQAKVSHSLLFERHLRYDILLGTHTSTADIVYEIVKHEFRLKPQCPKGIRGQRRNVFPVGRSQPVPRVVSRLWRLAISLFDVPASNTTVNRQALRVLRTETFSVESLFARVSAFGREHSHAFERRSDEALGVRVTVARIASSLLDLERAGQKVLGKSAVKRVMTQNYINVLLSRTTRQTPRGGSGPSTYDAWRGFGQHTRARAGPGAVQGIALSSPAGTTNTTRTLHASTDHSALDVRGSLALTAPAFLNLKRRKPLRNAWAGGGGGERKILGKTCRPAASSGTMPTRENPGATPPGFEPEKEEKEEEGRKWGGEQRSKVEEQQKREKEREKQQGREEERQERIFIPSSARKRRPGCPEGVIRCPGRLDGWSRTLCAGPTASGRAGGFVGIPVPGLFRRGRRNEGWPKGYPSGSCLGRGRIAHHLPRKVANGNVRHVFYIQISRRRSRESNAVPLVTSIEGAVFNITRVNRLHMGAYLCIASNGVPPTVSKRIMLIVHCEYTPHSAPVIHSHAIYGNNNHTPTQDPSNALETPGIVFSDTTPLLIWPFPSSYHFGALVAQWLGRSPPPPQPRRSGFDPRRALPRLSYVGIVLDDSASGLSLVPPMIWIQNQLVGAQEGQEMTLECHSEAYPKSINYWTREKGEIIAQGKCKFAIGSCITLLIKSTGKINRNA
ncbi:hypothetical protein PR048_032287 [Dryococelus australis]|uniref:Ig-like domain-containing protein n=1 Tax=Dryococelus australis TaxID=614101 RepID=A0ABQ9G5X7_9NEOP|nr:hypothetical protein PR048_032287 [Dryococelus australis]